MTDDPVEPPRLAALGDVHGNVAALDAVLAQVRALGITDGVCTGDLVLRGPEPEACVSRLAILGWPCVAGNTDEKVALRRPRSLPHPGAERAGSRSWTTHRLSVASLDYLRDLPRLVRVPLGPYTVLVTHGAPDDPREVLVHPDTPGGQLAQLALELGVDCVVTGHTHRPFVRRAGRCLFVNPGSVGEADGADRHPSWAVLEAGPAGITAQLMRTEVPLARLRAA